jgi:predicted ATPase
VRIGLLGGFAVEHDGASVEVVGAMQRALLFRLALDPGTQLGYRALAEDIWPDDPPENARAALQSLVSRLRSQLPPESIESLPGGYRLAVERRDVDAVLFQDLVAAASAAPGPEAVALAGTALELWTGEPWTPGDGYDWLERALRDDRATAVRLGGVAVPAAQAPSAIPAPLTPIIGRDEELASVAGQLARARLVTILGPGGAGKTRIAVEAARAHRRPIVVELAPAGPEELWQAILGATVREVRVAESTGASPRDRIVVALAGREVLLVLDNCEHLIEAAAEAAFELLGALPHLRVLTTSREPLGLPGEAFVPLGPLSADAAAELFAERVRAARGDPLEEGELDAASRIRRRLDGLPLALELAAAKARTMSIDEVAAGLDDRFALLTGGLRTVLPRHQTLRALVDWSWSLLSEGERALLGAVAIYPAGIAAANAERATRAHGGTPAELDSLVDKSLLQRSAGRYRALETIREYGIEKLVESGRLSQRRVEQARWLGETATEHDAGLRRPDSMAALAWFDAEDDNIISAIRFAVEGGHGAEAVRLAAATAWYWVIRDRNEDAATWLTAAAPLAGDGTSDADLIVRTIATASTAFEPAENADFLAQNRAQLEAIARAASLSENELLQVVPIVIAAFIEAMAAGSWPNGVEIPRDEDLPVKDWSRAVLGVMRAAIAQNRGDVAELGEASEAALRMFERVGDVWGLAISKQMRAEWLALEGRLEEALHLSDESTRAIRQITSAQDLQQQQGLAVTLLAKLGRHEEARERASELLAEARESESTTSLRLALYSNILLRLQLDELDNVDELLAELDAVTDAVPVNQHQLRALDSIARGGVASRRGELDDAEVHLRAAADEALASHDHPIMAAVALSIGALSLERGELRQAATALDLAVALRGAADPHDATEARIRAATGVSAARDTDDGDTRPALEGTGHASFDRETAAAALAQIFLR